MFDLKSYNWIKFALFAAFVAAGTYAVYQAGYNGFDLLPPPSAFGGALGMLVFIGAVIGAVIAVITDMVWLRIIALIAAFVLGVVFNGLASGLGEFFSSLPVVQIVLSIVAVFAIATFGLWLSRRD